MIEALFAGYRECSGLHDSGEPHQDCLVVALERALGADTVRAFATDLLRDYVKHSHGDIDGADVQDMIVKHGLGIPRPITQAEIDSDLYEMYDPAAGDEIVVYSEEMLRLLEEGR